MFISKSRQYQILVHKMAWKAKLPHEEPRFKALHDEHRRRVRTATFAVDDLPPHLLSAFYLKVSNLTSGTSRLRQIIRENKILAQKINVINRTKGKTDTHLRPYVRYEKFDKIMIPKTRKQEEFNRMMHEQLVNTPPVYSYQKIYNDWKRNEKLIFEGSRFPEVLTNEELIKLGRKWTIQDIPATPDSLVVKLKRPRVFMELETAKGFRLGSMEFVLYSDVVPLTVANFMALCTGDNTERLCYRGTPIFRINPGLYCQCGDVTRKTGPGGRSIYGELFDDENFKLKHAGPGVLSMCNFGCINSNNSQFMITFRALHSLDGKNVVFGKMVTGMQTLYNLENLGTRSGAPRKEIFITQCGEIKRKKVKKHRKM